VKQFADSWKAVQAAEALVIEGEKALDKARTAEGAARTAWLAGYRRLHAQLTDKYPTDKRHVGWIFRSVAAPKAKKTSEEPVKATPAPAMATAPHA
jgi:hypothetical protein